MTMYAQPDGVREQPGLVVQAWVPMNAVLVILLLPLRPLIALVAATLGTIMIIWVVVMIMQHFAS